jgi:hypothetical protein
MSSYVVVLGNEAKERLEKPLHLAKALVGSETTNGIKQKIAMRKRRNQSKNTYKSKVKFDCSV